jgi:hypothetical protein
MEDNIKMNLQEIWWEGVDRIYLDQDKDQWRAIMSRVTNLRFHKRRVNCLIAELLSVFQAGFCSMELVR